MSSVPVGQRFHGDRFEAGHRGAGGVGAVGAVGDEDFRAFFAAVAEVGGGDPEGGQLAMRTGGRLERAGGEAGDFLQVFLQLVEQLQHALERVFRLIRMQVGEAGHAGDALVPLRVVLHRAGAERIEVRVDAHVELREVREVAHDLRFAELGQGRGRAASAAAGSSFSIWPLGHIARRQPMRRRPGFGEFEQEFCIAGVTH